MDVINLNMELHSMQNDPNLHASSPGKETSLERADRSQSQGEILRRRSWSNTPVVSHLGCRTLSDSCVDGLRNSSGDLRGLDNVAFENCEDLEISKGTLENSSIGPGEESSSDMLKYYGGHDLAQQKSSCSSNRSKGVALALISTIFMSLSSLTVALLRGRVQSNEVAFAQMFIEFLFCLPLATLERASLWLPKKALALVLYRSMVGSFCTILAYFAFQVMPIGNAKAIIYSSPVFTGLFSCIFLHEACTVVDILLSILILSGVLLVIQPPFIFGGDQTSTTILGPIFCIIVAVLVGTIFITLRQVGIYRIHPATLLLYLTIVGMVMSIIMCSALKEWIIPRCGKDRILLFLTGTLQFIAQIALTQALRFEKATTVALIRTADVVFTFILDYLFFNIIPNAITLTGAILIIGSLIGITLYKMRSEQEAEGKSSEETSHDEDQTSGVSGDHSSRNG